MIIKPRITDEALDQRLAGLVDRELAERLVAANPELYKHLKERGDILPAFVADPPRERIATPCRPRCVPDGLRICSSP